MAGIRRNGFWIIALFLIAGNAVVHLDQSSVLRPAPVEAQTAVANYNETWFATELALTQISDWTYWWYYSYLGAQYKTTSPTAWSWVAGRSRSLNSGMYWWYYYWWWWYYYGNSSGASNDLSPHGFVTKWHVDGTLTR